eukprot:CAMPEP_0113547458 /NCGR_PEP_ID=MMETSP0015_2-20120614/12366_1 /TAXON_ID=2838 /ORGANISM="Odontella" /LENGTH=340 /DNA_ID=CAMNT_0000448013 /DNA_START=208 /DNA_END=1230 /DNA_ORIENTATION=- /assembly_acc=CAM_ASM_000160
MVRTSVLAAGAAAALLSGTDAFLSNDGTARHRAFSRTSLSASNANEIVPMKPGSTCALITPFTPSGEVDVPALRSLLQFHVESGTDGLCILGTTAEASVLTMDERATVLNTAVEECKGTIPLLVGTGTIDPAHVKDMTQQAIDLGCDASLVVTPYYVKPPQRGLVKHMLSMADLGLPVVIYNVPGRTGVDMTPESIALCADHENVVGVKEATGDVTRVDDIRKLTGEKLLLLSGDDGTDAEFVLRGGDGCISVTANVAPREKHELMLAALRGDKDEVKRIGGPLELLNNRLFVEANPIPAKWAAMRVGKIDCAYCRPPLDELDPEHHGFLEEALKEAGLI